MSAVTGGAENCDKDYVEYEYYAAVVTVTSNTAVASSLLLFGTPYFRFLRRMRYLLRKVWLLTSMTDNQGGRNSQPESGVGVNAAFARAPRSFDPPLFWLLATQLFTIP